MGSGFREPRSLLRVSTGLVQAYPVMYARALRLGDGGLRKKQRKGLRALKLGGTEKTLLCKVGKMQKVWPLEMSGHC